MGQGFRSPRRKGPRPDCGDGVTQCVATHRSAVDAQEKICLPRYHLPGDGDVQGERGLSLRATLWGLLRKGLLSEACKGVCGGRV